VDIYSAAMCAYYIIAGSAPFSNLAGQQVAELAARVSLRPVLAVKGFENPRLGDFMARAWAHDAAQRPDASACVQEIELIIADEEARLRLSAARSSTPVQAIHRLCKAFTNHINAGTAGTETACCHTSSQKFRDARSSSPTREKNRRRPPPGVSEFLRGRVTASGFKRFL
jgi:hypothetical protein